MTLGDRTCGAKTRHGGRCNRIPAPGYPRCHWHGARAGRPPGTPQHVNTRAAAIEGRRRWLAKMRLARARDSLRRSRAAASLGCGADLTHTSSHTRHAYRDINFQDRAAAACRSRRCPARRLRGAAQRNVRAVGQMAKVLRYGENPARRGDPGKMKGPHSETAAGLGN